MVAESDSRFGDSGSTGSIDRSYDVVFICRTLLPYVGYDVHPLVISIPQFYLIPIPIPASFLFSSTTIHQVEKCKLSPTHETVFTIEVIQGV